MKLVIEAYTGFALSLLLLSIWIDVVLSFINITKFYVILVYFVLLLLYFYAWFYSILYSYELSLQEGFHGNKLIAELKLPQSLLQLNYSTVLS